MIEKLKGKFACNESRDWKVLVYFNTAEDDYIYIGKQLTREEATKLYEELKRKFDNKEKYIEVEIDNEIFLLNKDNIILIRVKN